MSKNTIKKLRREGAKSFEEFKKHLAKFKIIYITLFICLTFFYLIPYSEDVGFFSLSIFLLLLMPVEYGIIKGGSNKAELKTLWKILTGLILLETLVLLLVFYRHIHYFVAHPDWFPFLLFFVGLFLLGGCIGGMLYNSYIASSGTLLLIAFYYNVSKAWCYLQRKPSPKPFYFKFSNQNQLNHNILQDFLYYFTEILWFSSWFILLIISTMTVPPKVITSFSEIGGISILLWSIISSLFIFPLFLAESSGVLWQGKTVSVKRFHKYLSIFFLFVVAVKFATWGESFVPQFLYALLLCVFAQSGLAFGYVITEKVANKRFIRLAYFFYRLGKWTGLEASASNP